jgi:hypothetical protein
MCRYLLLISQEVLRFWQEPSEITALHYRTRGIFHDFVIIILLNDSDAK